MTLLDEPPVVTEPPVERPIVARSTPSAWRLALRLARRETHGRPGRTVLAALLIAVPVSAMTIGSAFARAESGSWPAQFARRYGDADIAVDPSMWWMAQRSLMWRFSAATPSGLSCSCPCCAKTCSGVTSSSPSTTRLRLGRDLPS